MAFSLLSAARYIRKPARSKWHFPCNPKFNFVIAKTPYHVQNITTRHPNHAHASVSALEEVRDPETYSAAPDRVSNTKPKPGRHKARNSHDPFASHLARKILNNQWGHSEFRLEQEAVISRLIAGGSAAVVFPTGSGKSLLYQIPALAFDQWDKKMGKPVEPGVTLVISPLIALMKDQTEDLMARGIKAAAVDSSKTQESICEIYDLLKSNELKLLYCSPERLNSEALVEAIQHTRIRMIAVDEAHCVFEWGESFRPEYLKSLILTPGVCAVARFVREVGVERVLCLTATATPQVSTAICSAFDIPKDGLFRATSYRPNLHLLAESFMKYFEKMEYLKDFLARNRGASIVYVTFRMQAEEVAEQLANDGFKASSYHAGMSPSARAHIQEKFMKADDIIIVATIAFGLGINKPNIRNIVHYDYPRSLEGYSQEIGRAGRDGKPSKCMLFLCASDWKSREYFQRASTPNKRHVRGLLRGLFKWYKTAEAGDTIQSNLLAQSKNWEIQESTLNVLYAKLELRFGLLRAVASKFTCCVYKPAGNFTQKVKSDTSNIAQKIISLARGDEKKKSIDVSQVADDLGIRREVVIQKLEEWDRKLIIDLRSNGVLSRYRMLKPFPQDPLVVKELIDMVHDQIKVQKAEEAKGGRKVIDLVTSTSCFARGLAKHFGDLNVVPKKGCGKCQWCRTKVRVILKEQGKSHADRKRIEAVLAAYPGWRDPELLAKIAYGIRGPKTFMAMTRSKQRVYGSMSDCDFDDLVDRFSRFCNRYKDEDEMENDVGQNDDEYGDGSSGIDYGDGGDGSGNGGESDL